MSSREFHKIWTEQCDAAHDIRLRYGQQAASCGITAVRESCVIRFRGNSHAVLRTIGTAIESNCHIDDSGSDGSVSDL
jgi:hypothetical protein